MTKEATTTKSEIPGWAFIALGILVFGVSIIMNLANKDSSMFLFIIAGLGLVGWGAAKYIIFGKKGKADLDKPEKMVEMPEHNRQQNGQQQQTHHQRNVKNCPKCGYALNPHDNFCYNCGADVRHH
jgi:hypothetical protein